MRIKIIVASNNLGKIEEIKSILQGYEIRSQGEAGVSLECHENADSFLGNALIKARALQAELARRGEHEALILADDSGICIQALDGKPGIFSARYANLALGIAQNSSDEANRACVIKALHQKGLQSSPARFVAGVVLLGVLYKDNRQYEINLQAQGECAGVVFDEERGSYGFGYDSLFQPDGYDVRLAELQASVKNSLSHRYKALKILASKLHERLGALGIGV